MVDIQEVPRDQVLEGLGLALDPESMHRRLQPHFPGLELLQVKLERFTYKPGRSARLTYRIKLLDPAAGLKARHVMHGRMEPRGEMAALHAKMSRQRWAQPRFGPALLWFEDLGLLLWGFPNDPKLRGIARVARSEGFLPLLRGLPSLGFVPETCDSSIVKYVPGKRLVMRHKIAAPGAHATLYSKTYGHERGASIHAVMRHLWRHAQHDAEALTLPEPLAWFEDGSTLLLRGLPGTAAISELQGAHLERCMRQAGRGLAHIHTSGVEGLEYWGEAHEFEYFLDATAMLLRWDAELASPIARLRELGQQGLAAIETRSRVPIHGAFRFTQLLAHRERLALVDFDGFKQGHPMCDTGSFVAHLHYLLAKGELDEPACRTAVHAFLDAYAAQAPCDEQALRWYAAMILVGKHAQKCVKRLKQDGDAKIRRMLALGEDLLCGRLPLR